MSEAKIVLSDKELEMVNNREWILTKQKIIQQVYVLLESVVVDIDLFILAEWQTLCKQIASPPRIFKGENYLGLPYVTLDHPRLFSTENTFTVRTMFWWGNFVSITLHAGDAYKNHVINKLNLLNDRDGNLYLCIHESQWHHHFEPDNYTLLKNVSEEKLKEVSKRNFVKIAYKINLLQFNDLNTVLSKHYKMLAEIMA